MGHTNSTANLALPQFVGSDKPTWLGDINGAFSDIDAYVGTNDAAVAVAASDASSAVSQASSAVSTANAANTTAGNASTAATNAVTVANNAVAIAGTVDSKVGLLANLNTTDRTSIVNAINEVYGMSGGDSVSVTADGVKTVSQLFNELYALVDASKVKTGSTLSYGIEVFQIILIGSYYGFMNFGISPTDWILKSATVASSTSSLRSVTNAIISDDSATVPALGTVITITY